MDDAAPVINVTDTSPHHGSDGPPPTGDNALVMSPRATPAPAPSLAGTDPFSMETDVQPPVHVFHVAGTCPVPTETAPLSTDDGAYPAPAGAVPPSAEQISSFLRHVRRQATDGATATATSAAAVLTVPFSPDVTEGDATATAGSPADTGLGVGTYPAHIDTAPPAVDGTTTTAAAGGAAPTVATATAVTGVTKKRRIKHNRAAQDARKS